MARRRRPDSEPAEQRRAVGNAGRAEAVAAHDDLRDDCGGVSHAFAAPHAARGDTPAGAGRRAQRGRARVRRAERRRRRAHDSDFGRLGLRTPKYDAAVARGPTPTWRDAALIAGGGGRGGPSLHFTTTWRAARASRGAGGADASLERRGEPAPREAGRTSAPLPARAPRRRSFAAVELQRAGRRQPLRRRSAEARALWTTAAAASAAAPAATRRMGRRRVAQKQRRGVAPRRS